MELVRIRLKETSDEPFIYNSWLQSQRAKHPNIPKTDYYSHYKKVIADILYKSVAMVACDPESPDFIYGYTIVRPIEDMHIIHYAYTKKPFRRFGLMRDLLKSQGLNLSEPLVLTCKAPEFLETKYTLVYRPNLKGL